MITKRIVPLFLVFLSVLASAQSTANSTDQHSEINVSGTGCLEPGIESGCFVLRDLHSGKNFNLFFKENPPKLNTAGEFEGVESSNPNTCMQGKAVDVTKWTAVRLQCPQSKPETLAPALSQKCDDWYAWYNVQPTAPKALHLAGVCTVRAGSKASLVPRKPQGINPHIYIVDLVITPPKGKGSNLEIPIQVHYSEKTDSQYDSIDIEPDHTSVPVRIIQ